MARGTIAVNRVSGPSELERTVRLDVAKAYRLLAWFGMDDLTDGFVSARRGPGSRDVVIGGYGAMPALVRASELFVRSLDAAPVIEQHGGVDVDALRFSKAIYDARPDANAVIHAHPPATLVYSTLDTEMLPISQYGFMFYEKVGVVPFLEHDVTSAEATGQIGRAVRAGMEAVLLQNHGLVVFGRTVAQAFWTLYRLEQTFRIQLEAMRTGARLITHPPEKARAIRDGYWTETFIENDGAREWPGFSRLLDRDDPSYRD